MSKGNMLLGHARGKVGDLVFSRSNGQQVVRARAAVVKNPQTEKQMIQRVILATVAQAYSRMSAICDHSFEGVQSGQKSMSVFLRKNLDLLRSKITAELAAGGELNNVAAFTPINSNLLSINDYIISSGSLPSVETTFVSGQGATIAVDGTTYADVISSLNLQRGDQLTFVAIVGNTADKLTFEYARVILDPRDTSDNALPLSTPFVDGGSIVSPNPRNEGSFTALTLASGSLGWSLAKTGQLMDAIAVVVSRQLSDGSWKRSNATLLSNGANASFTGYTMQEALDLFTSGAFATNSGLYLNNAGVSVTAQQAGGEAIVVPIAAGGNGNATVVSIVTVNGRPMARTVDGQDFYIHNCGTYNSHYGQYLYNKNGANALATDSTSPYAVTNPDNAWAIVKEGSALIEMSEKAVDFNFGGNWQQMQWLVAQGVNPKVVYGFEEN